MVGGEEKKAGWIKGLILARSCYVFVEFILILNCL